MTKWGLSQSSGAQGLGTAQDTADATRRARPQAGTAASWVNLHAFVPVSFSMSRAIGISDDGVNCYISGSDYNMATGRWEALLWVMPVPAPGSVALLGPGALAASRRRR